MLFRVITYSNGLLWLM